MVSQFAISPDRASKQQQQQPHTQTTMKFSAILIACIATIGLVQSLDFEPVCNIFAVAAPRPVCQSSSTAHSPYLFLFLPAVQQQQPAPPSGPQGQREGRKEGREEGRKEGREERKEGRKEE
jgi:hypothetical protein